MDRRKIRRPMEVPINPVTVKGNNVVTNELFPYFPSRSVPGNRKDDHFNFFATVVTTSTGK